MNPILHDLHNKQWVWTAANAKQQQLKQQRISGFKNLDKVLSGGFPHAGMIHLQSALGCGELRLMLAMLEQQNALCDQGASEHGHFENSPLVQKRTQHNSSEYDQKLYIFINPPFTLNAEFLLSHNITLQQLVVINAKSTADALWTAEQSVKSGACTAVFIWQQQLSHTHIKKLELAAQQGQSYCIWLQSALDSSAQTTKQQNLPLSLSLSITRQNDLLEITVNKQKIGWAQNAVHVPLPFRSRTNAVLQKQREQQKINNVIALNSHSINR